MTRTPLWILQAVVALALWTLPGSAGAVLVGVNYHGTVVTIDPVSGTAVEVGDTAVPTLNSLARLADRLMSVSRDTSELIELDAATYELVGRGVLDLHGVGVDVRSLASRGSLLLAANQTDGGLYSIDSASRVGSRIGTLGDRIQGMDFAPDGVLYGWSASAGLIRVDVGNASSVDVNVDAAGPIIQSLTFISDDELIGFSTDTAYSIDRNTGIATQLGVFAGVDLRGVVSVPEASPLSLLGAALAMSWVHERLRFRRRTPHPCERKASPATT